MTYTEIIGLFIDQQGTSRERNHGIIIKSHSQ